VPHQHGPSCDTNEKLREPRFGYTSAVVRRRETRALEWQASVQGVRNAASRAVDCAGERAAAGRVISFAAALAPCAHLTCANPISASTEPERQNAFSNAYVQRSEPSNPGRQLHDQRATHSCASRSMRVACGNARLRHCIFTILSGAKLRSIWPRMPSDRRRLNILHRVSVQHAREWEGARSSAQRECATCDAEPPPKIVGAFILFILFILFI
jgi:hypothetical protein